MKVSPELMAAYEAAIKEAREATPKLTVDLDFLMALAIVGMLGVASQHPAMSQSRSAQTVRQFALDLAKRMAGGNVTAEKAILSSFNPEMNEPGATPQETLN